MEQEYYGDVNDEDAYGDPFVGAPSSPPTVKLRGTDKISYLDVVQGKVTSTTLPSPKAAYASTRLRYFFQKMSDYAPYRTTVFTAVPNGSGVATITINTEDLQSDSAYSALAKYLATMYFTFGASPTSAVPAAQSTVTVAWYDEQQNSYSQAFTIERNTGQLTKVRFSGFKLLFGKPIVVAAFLQATATAKPLVISVSGLVGNANFSVELPGFNDERLSRAFKATNAS